mgnify:CR=1 FL=1
MMWQEPKTDWTNADPVRFKVDFYRIENNIAWLYFLLR